MDYGPIAVRREPALEEGESGLEASLDAHRPAGPTGAERRLGIAGVLRAAGIESDERRKLGRYRIEERLGGGAMGVVYRAHDPELDRTVAIKVLRSDAGADLRESIREEARALARLASPHVVAVHDVHTAGDDAFLAMEYVPGESLARWLAEHPDASFREILTLFVQAGRGLSDAHRASVVHRDFKPENVLVSSDGRVRVVDFGLARRHEPGQTVGAEGGTPHYLAPEVLAGGASSPASDQYSFCLALGESLGAGAGSGRDRVRAIVERGVRRDPHERWPSMDALVQALEQVLAPPEGAPMRRVLLDRVERLWIGGVLRASLGGASPVALPIETAPDLVAPPWAEWNVPPPSTRSSSTSNLDALLAPSHGSLLVLGAPGSGKTTALLALASTLAAEARDDPTAPAPVVLNLASFRPGAADMTAWIVDEIVAKYSLPRPAIQRWLSEEGVALLLDGLDELAPPHRAPCVEALNAFRAAHATPVVVTSREEEYVSTGVKLCFGLAVRILPPSEEEVDRILKSRGAPDRLASLLHEEAARKRPQSPLMLSLMSADGASAPSATEDLARDVYDRYVEHAFHGLPAEQKLRKTAALRVLARAMIRLNTSDLWLERMDSSWLSRPWEQRTSRYLSIAAIVILQVLCVGGVAEALDRPPRITIAVTFSAVLAVLVLTRGYRRVKPMESLRWSLRRAIRRLPIDLGLGLLIGGIVGLVDNFAANAAMGVLGALSLTVISALEPAERQARVRPNEGVLRSLRYGLWFSLLLPPVTSVIFAYGIFPKLATDPAGSFGSSTLDHSLQVTLTLLAFGIAILFMLQGGAAVIFHYMVRLFLALRTPLPLRLVPFLDECTERGLLRRIGGGYIFLHRTLLEHLAHEGSSHSMSATVDKSVNY